jgi:hypothetical protein
MAGCDLAGPIDGYDFSVFDQRVETVSRDQISAGVEAFGESRARCFEARSGVLMKPLTDRTNLHASSLTTITPNT